MAKQKNGYGSISYDKTRKNYRAAVTDPGGKRLYKRCATKEEAEAWVANTRSEIYKGLYVRPSDMTVGEWLTSYIELYKEPSVRPKTYLCYMQTAAHCAPIFEVPLQQLTAPMVQRMYLTFNMASSSKLKIHNLLKSAMAKAQILDLVQKNIMLAVDAPKLERKPIQIFTKEEISTILNFAKNDQWYCRYYLLLELAVSTGARLGELIGLKLCDVGANYISINCTLSDVGGVPTEMPPKTEAGRRRVTISQELAKELRAKGGNILNGYIFRSRRGTPYSTRSIERAWEAILSKAGVPYRNFHCIRHTTASMLLSAGVPLLEVSKRLGHSRASHTLNLYGHAIPGADEMIPETISKIFSIG